MSRGVKLTIAGVGFVALGIGAAVLSLRARATRLDEQATRYLDERYAAYRAARWTRPVLRGDAKESNAAAAQLEAARALASLPAQVGADFGERAQRGEGISPDLAAEAAKHAGELEAVRRASQGSWAYTALDLRDWVKASFTSDYTLALRAWKLLLARAAVAEPAECLRVTADVVRLGQDLGPGASLVGAMIGAVAASLVPPIAVACAAKADDAARDAAFAEYVSLAANAPPIGGALVTEWIGQTYAMRDIVRARADGPRAQWYAMDALEDALAHPPAWDGLRADRYSEAIAALKAEDARVAASTNPLVALRISAARFVEKDAQAQALVRATAIAIVAAGDGAAGAKTRAALENASLRDPFTTKPLRIEADPAGGLRVISYGANGVADAPTAGGEGDDAAVRIPARAP